MADVCGFFNHPLRRGAANVCGFFHHPFRRRVADVCGFLNHPFRRGAANICGYSKSCADTSLQGLDMIPLSWAVAVIYSGIFPLYSRPR